MYLFFIILTKALGDILSKDFKWGTGTASFQIEGAWNLGGRGPSIWDYFATFPGRIRNNDNANIADDFYHRYPEDIKIMKKLGIKNFRFSISWSRVLPTGEIDNVNPEGVKFYNELLDALLEAGIEPFVTLFHWVLPQVFNNFTAESTWLNPDVANKFNDYADFCFKNFGNKIKYWITMNEIEVFAWLGYGLGIHAPGRCSSIYQSWCAEVGGGGNSSTEPYIAAHNALIAHALAVNTYRTKYQKIQGGKIGMTMSTSFALPWNNSNIDDIIAADIHVAFRFGWIADPQVFGKYPDEMRSLIPENRLPQFNESMSKLIKGSYDFLGVNYYATHYAQWTGIPGSHFGNDGRYISHSYNASGHLIGPFASSLWLNVYAPGLRGMLNWIKNRYNNPEVYIFENGVSCPEETILPKAEALHDSFRMNYIYDHIKEIVNSYRDDNVNIKGYFLWSLIDNFEWSDGYDVRFGITYVDFKQNLERTIKDSGYLYRDLIHNLQDGKIPSENELMLKYEKKEENEYL